VVFRSLLEEMLDALMQDFRRGSPGKWSLDFVEAAKVRLQETLNKKERLNINPNLLLETLFFRLRKGL
jgi:hypothetical protein